MLDKEVAQFATAEAFENIFETTSTSTEDTEQNIAPPAALLAPEAHDAEEETELQLLNSQLKTRMLDETPIASEKLETFNGYDADS